jgi:hypothetical protein
MKRSLIVLGTLLVALYLGSVPASAQRGNRPTTAGASHGPSSNTSSTTTGRSTDPSPNPNSSPASVFGHSPNLATNLTNALANSGIPASVFGGNLATFCTSNNFKTLGQCIAALHINHKFSNCTFSELATGIGKALQTCHPTGDPKAEASKAMKQANAEIKSAKS